MYSSSSSSSSNSRVCHIMFHSEGCLNNVLHFFIVLVSLHFCPMTSITSWCLNVMIEWTLFVTGGKLFYLIIVHVKIREDSSNSIEMLCAVTVPLLLPVHSFPLDDDQKLLV